MTAKSAANTGALRDLNKIVTKVGALRATQKTGA
jgi:hypothetical protein